MSNTSLKDVLYDKSYVCPVCNRKFTSKTIKLGKNQVVSVDLDLYPHYSLVNPLLYDILFCEFCGYAATSKNFDTLLPKQKEWIRNQICSNYKSHTFSEFVTTEEAIYKHKMALLACLTKKGKVGEQAYIALHIAWLYRDLEDTENEIAFLERAYDGFSTALSTERFPILGLDEITTMYMLAALAYKLGKPIEAKKYLGSVLTTAGISERVKDRALDLKTILNQE
ncbi:hypothetical protein CS063_01045 [Sporanaerobium hydrogeniformans]|uniref:Uncharacterized protein n=1 Tax=Sporanaerobium hydrogeniformans TaxID=3072179 RepID=A0AC61DHQ1_9FIRM|nr:DUF2225 domain-containing protein [Sporanaerobium hydrogeniformans]PHV72096.1 hypothetical protein CS063_01045 [Sporanaerobium hydrogeniformans]